MKILRHPNIVLLMGATMNEKKQFMIVTEYASRGDLHHCIKHVHGIELRCRMVENVLQGLNWLTAHSILHRDLKLDNLLVTRDWVVKVTDFGLSISASVGMSYDKFGGNIKFSAPEILSERSRQVSPREKKRYRYCEKTEVYSFGLIAYQILTKLTPFSNRPEVYKGREGLSRMVIEGHRPDVPKDWPSTLSSIITNSWGVSPEKRPTFKYLLQQWYPVTLDLLCPDMLARRVVDSLWTDPTVPRDYIKIRRSFLRECTVSRVLTYKQEKLLSAALRDDIYNSDVTFERFCLVVGWYGGLDKTTNCSDFFKRIRDLSKQACVSHFSSSCS